MPAKKVFFLVLFLVACSTTSPDATKNDVTKKSNWSYEGETGPDHWADINPDYAACTNGKEQSPINIETSQVIEDKNIANLNITYRPTVVSLRNIGHTIQGIPSTLNNSFVVDNKEYTLTQFHFHTPSEHQFNGHHFAMEVHFVHKDANNELAVLGLMIKEGASNPTLERPWNVIPTEETTVDVKWMEPLDLMSLLPKDKDSFRYHGSLTTPPCSEAVKWIVLEEPIEMSKEQIDKFRKIFPDNHRPVQPLNERKVKKVD